MPCYDPPMPWENPRRVNADKAAAMMCARIKPLVQGVEPGRINLSNEELVWFHEHRTLDAMRAHTYGEISKFQEATRDARLAEEVLRQRGVAVLVSASRSANKAIDDFVAKESLHPPVATHLPHRQLVGAARQLTGDPHMQNAVITIEKGSVTSIEVTP